VNTGTKRRTKLGMALEQSAKEILAHVKAETRPPARHIVPRIPRDDRKNSEAVLDALASRADIAKNARRLEEDRRRACESLVRR